jgi:16S rRNA (guanine527-N7)-methyltransferase
MERKLEALLRSGAAELGLTLEDRIVQGLGRYLDLLLFWNKRVSLTAVREPEAVIEKHFIDSLAVVPHIPSAARSLGDIGSGPGFPGAVIALARPDLAVALVESIHKKAAFLGAIRRDLGLSNVTVHATRAEEWSRHTAPPDVVVSRATWDLVEWLELGRTWVAPGGVVIGMEGSTRHGLPPEAVRHLYGPHRAIITLRT